MTSADGANGRTPQAGGMASSDGTGPFRSLPDRPDIEFEKKRAKRLLRSARSGDADAIRTITTVARDGKPGEWTLSLAQLAVAREYGFSSWPRLSRYYARWATLASTGGRSHVTLAHLGNVSQWIRNGQTKGLEFYAQTIATYLPRLYGKTNAEVLASPISDDEARFVAAREYGFANWADAASHAATDPYEGMSPDERRSASQTRIQQHRASPAGLMLDAIRTMDVARVRELIAAHPELTNPPADGPDQRGMLWGQAIHTVLERPSPLADELLDLLRWERGGSQNELDRLLAHNCRWPGAVAWLISRGANPDRVWPNGASTLEHALVWYNLSQSTPSAVDALVPHVARIPRAMWVAAGLGDISAVRGYFDRRGRLKAAARRHRFDMALFTQGGGVFNPDADDEAIIFEVGSAAVLNGRTDVLALLLDLGFPVDAAPHNTTLLHAAVSCASDVSVEFLLSRGANPDCKQLWNRSPRWLAREAATVDVPGNPQRNRVHQLLESAPPGADVEARPTGR